MVCEERLRLPGEQRCGLVRLMVEVRLSPTCAFLSCCAGREMKCVFRRRNLRYFIVRYIHGSVAEASASWSPLLSFVGENVSAQKGLSCTY